MWDNRDRAGGLTLASVHTDPQQLFAGIFQKSQIPCGDDDVVLEVVGNEQCRRLQEHVWSKEPQY